MTHEKRNEQKRGTQLLVAQDTVEESKGSRETEGVIKFQSIGEKIGKRN